MQYATKTTLTELLQAASSQASFLIANSIDEVIELPETVVPLIGQYWHGQGGFYAGVMRDKGRQWHLLLAAENVNHNTLHNKTSPCAIQSAWGTYGKTLPGEFSQRDGMHNTLLILNAEPRNKIAAQFSALSIDGHNDFYWPSQCEINLLFSNLPEHLKPEWHWSSTQFSSCSAWSQNAEHGHQLAHLKFSSWAARAVRRIAI